MAFFRQTLFVLIVSMACAAGAGPAVFDAAITVNGSLTITGGSMKATSAETADGASIILGSADTQLILESETTANIVRGLLGYRVVTEAIMNANSDYVVYFLKAVGFILSIQ